MLNNLFANDVETYSCVNILFNLTANDGITTMLKFIFDPVLCSIIVYITKLINLSTSTFSCNFTKTNNLISLLSIALLLKLHDQIINNILHLRLSLLGLGVKRTRANLPLL